MDDHHSRSAVTLQVAAGIARLPSRDLAGLDRALALPGGEQRLMTLLSRWGALTPGEQDYLIDFLARKLTLRLIPRVGT